MYKGDSQITGLFMSQGVKMLPPVLLFEIYGIFHLTVFTRSLLAYLLFSKVLDATQFLTEGP